eukprot:Rhum_TRINITY_DN14889_c26_g1::Rhum_TRINITY_DN14889_c26_g1_i1::g.126506::m.126506
MSSATFSRPADGEEPPQPRESTTGRQLRLREVDRLISASDASRSDASGRGVTAFDAAFPSAASSAAAAASPRVNLLPQEASWRTRRVRSEVDAVSGARTVAQRWEDRSEAALAAAAAAAGGGGGSLREPWRPRPRPRSGHTLTMVQAEGLVVMFGGLGDDAEATKDPVLNDLWLYRVEDGAWTEVHPAGEAPSPVFGHTAELVDASPANLCMLVFGGQSAGGALASDTYILSGILHAPTWHKLPQPTTPLRGPLTRWGHTMVPVREAPNTVSWFTGEAVPESGNLQLVVFGGMAESYESLSDLLAFDVSELRWRDLTPDTSPRFEGEKAEELLPMGRRRHVAAVDGTNRKMWIFGGRSEWNSFLADMWCFDVPTRRWTHVTAPHAPKPRTGHCSAMHANHLYVFGGFELTKSSDDEWVYVLYNDLHRFDTAARTWEELHPESCTRHHLCPDLSKPCVEPRRRSMAACFVDGDRLVVHGGRNKDCAFDCSFALPLSSPARATLAELVAQRLVDSGGAYRGCGLPGHLERHLDSLFAPPTNPDAVAGRRRSTSGSSIRRRLIRNLALVTAMNSSHTGSSSSSSAGGGMGASGGSNNSFSTPPDVPLLSASTGTLLSVQSGGGLAGMPTDAGSLEPATPLGASMLDSGYSSEEEVVPAGTASA